MVTKLNLQNLPYHIIKKNKYYFINTKTGKLIHKDQIENSLPKPQTTIEVEQEKIERANWWRSYYGNT